MHAPFTPPDVERSVPLAARRVTWQCEALTQEVVEALQTEWTQLAEEASEKNVFQFSWFILNSLPLLASKAPNIVTIRLGTALVGLVIVHRDLGYAKLPIPFWTSALHPEQFLGTPLVRTGSEDVFAAGLCGWLDESPLQYCFIKLSQITADGPVSRAIIDHCRREKRAVLSANRNSRAAIAPGDWRGSTADSLLSSSRRKSLKRSMKRLLNQGDVSIEKLGNADQLANWTERFLALEDTGWKHEAGSSILSCEHETGLYRAIIRTAFKNGNLHFSRLCLNGEPIAYTLDIHAPPTGFSLKSAIDPRFRKASPGVLMEYETLKYYLGREELALIDSCTAPDNAMLNELWPDRQPIMDLAISRKGTVYDLMFRSVRAAKALLGRAEEA
jgi:CelD/BcsL family acetyltransferase involved in cellulose biosynthesis